MSDKRAAYPFRWYVTCDITVYAALADVRFDLLFKDAAAIEHAYCTGEPKARALYGDGIRYGGPAWAGISYGHVNCLGAPLRFPADSEVAHAPIYGSLREGIRALQRPVDWAASGMMPFYLTLWEELKRRFPGHDIPFAGFGVEGPVTTAWELRGHGLFADLYDDPTAYGEYLSLVTESVISYRAFTASVNGQPAFSPSGVSLYDDISSLIGPALWPEVVLPYQERFFAAQTDGRRHAHIENLVPDHLGYLDALRLDSFDPSVSPRLRPRDLRDRCVVPFLWRLNAMQLRDLDVPAIRRFVLESVGDGASGVFLGIARTMLDATSVAKVRTFIAAAQEVERLLQQGHSREAIAELARWKGG